MIVSTTAVLAVGVAAFALWVVSVVVRDVSLIDILWGPAYAIVALAVAYDRSFDLHPAQWGLIALVSVWGVRLGAYLAWRNHGKGEDPRYAAMRERVGPSFRWRSLVTVFALQAALVMVVSLPIQTAVAPGLSVGWSAWHGVGAAAWAVGLVFEAVGDAQLARFRADADQRGRVLDTGLWRYTRHPNYFGDFMVWWGFYVYAVACGAPWWTAVGPAVMSWLLMRVSGVPLLEQSLKARRPAYAEYIRRTSAFFPRPPRA